LSFLQTEYPVFLVVVLVLYWSLRRAEHQNALLVVASLLFYGWVHPWIVLLLLGSANLDFWVARGMARWPGYRRKLLLLSVAGNLGLLCWFKYFDFFVENAIYGLRSLGVQSNLSTLGILLPVGISFYTFQTLSYTIDVYRGRMQPRRRLIDYLAFVTFFPQLIAGPIERARNLLPQLESQRRLNLEQVRGGITLLLWGAFIKVVVADTIAPWVDAVFLLRSPAGMLLWAASAAFGLQLYADFQGYTNMARGAARLFGIELTTNFREPFLAHSTPEFWRRWHTSLSYWIRDYLLVPLVGSSPRTSRLRVVASVAVTFLLMGAWHGAGWNYLLFGLWHAAWVLAAIAVGPYLPQLGPRTRWAAAVVHGVVVLLPGGLLFREPRVSRALTHLVTPPWHGDADAWVHGIALLALTATLATPLLLVWASRRWIAPVFLAPRCLVPLETASWAAMGLTLLLFHRVTVGDFIYFQF
jgi:alginate O-acetyltransferase complex protein AlgI